MLRSRRKTSLENKDMIVTDKEVFKLGLPMTIGWV